MEHGGVDGSVLDKVNLKDVANIDNRNFHVRANLQVRLWLRRGGKRGFGEKRGTGAAREKRGGRQVPPPPPPRRLRQ